jgi:hypothetical protein
MKHLRRRVENTPTELCTACAAIADERETRPVFQEAHAAFVAGCAGYSKDSQPAKFRRNRNLDFRNSDLIEKKRCNQNAFQNSQQSKKVKRRSNAFCIFNRWPNGSRYPLGEGGDNAALTESTSSQETAKKRGAYPKSGARIVRRLYAPREFPLWHVSGLFDHRREDAQFVRRRFDENG